VSDEDRAALMLAGVYGALALLGLWSMASGPLCAADVFTRAQELDQAMWCFEFWLNRYQTGIASLLALAAALLATVIGRRQLRTSNVGLAIAQRQTAAVALETIEKRRTLIRDASKLINDTDSAIQELLNISFKESVNYLNNGFKEKRLNAEEPLRDAMHRAESVETRLNGAISAIDSKRN
jgi:hypothetical protein